MAKAEEKAEDKGFRKLEADDLVNRRFEITARIKDLQAEAAHLNLELTRRGLKNHGGPCW